MISQVFSDESTAMVLDRRCPLTGLDVRTRVVLAFMTNGVWLPVFNNESGKQVSLTANVIYVDACGCMRCFEKASINTLYVVFSPEKCTNSGTLLECFRHYCDLPWLIGQYLYRSKYYNNSWPF